MMGMVVRRGEKELIKIWQNLSKEDRHSLVMFARFLNQQKEEEDDDTTMTLEEEITLAGPVDIPAPDQENAVQALKRLKKTYPMVETDMSLLDEASRLVAKAVMGASHAAVILEMEKLFVDRYQNMQGGVAKK
ncbi:hypothetical protein ACQZV8_13115 [Magnetococcales bacterium HHB-1]